jgi:hypothetical protein
VRKIKNACKMLIGKPEGKRSFGRLQVQMRGYY